MSTKKFTGKSFQNAVEKAKDELGEEIIIIDTQEVISGGFLSEEKKIVEILVSTAEHDLTTGGPSSEKEAEPVKKEPKKVNQGILPKKISQSLQYTYLSNELEKLNEYVSKLIFDDFPKILVDFKDILQKTGVTNDDAVKLIAGVQKRLHGLPVLTDHLIMGSLESVTQVYLKGKNLFRNYEQKVLVFVGPAGVGKTLSIMKLATNKKLIGERTVAIVSTDCYRMAATEMLDKFTKLTSIPVYETRNAEEFSNQIAKLNNIDVILVDTPGNNVMDHKYFSEMDTYFRNYPNIKKLLILSNSLDQQMINQYITEYSKLDITGMIITKTDELNFPGKILSIAMSTNLPIYFIGTGQSIPGDLEENKDGLLWGRIEERIKEIL
ncbi:MAG: hypothetical protein JXQ65_07760 [Candidatus Marinimicrobia bacterium]|nr:hypothetical protein [Candidatus Neomarinimicrobiota bacterium]